LRQLIETAHNMQCETYGKVDMIGRLLTNLV